MGQHKFKVGDRARVTRDFMDVRKDEIVLLDSRAPYAAPAWHVVTNACKMVWVAEAVLAPLTAPAKAEGPVTTAYPDDNPKTVVGLSKPGTAAIPPIAIIELGRAMADGERKYGRLNWRDKMVTTSVYTDAIDRHMLAFRDGEDDARDSRIAHLAHVMACCAILIDAFSINKINDDRRCDGKVADRIEHLTKG